VGSFVSPYIIKLSEVEDLNPYLAIGIITLVGPIGAMLIEETLNKPLKDDIEETMIKHMDLVQEE
jgi:hypothetical protein